MSTITKEWLQQKIADMEAARDEIPFGLDEDESNTLAAMKLALASLEAEAVAYVDPFAFHNFSVYRAGKTDNKRMGREWMWANPDAGLIPVYTSQPAPVTINAEPVAWLWSHRKHPSEVTLVRPEDDEKAGGAHWSGWSCQVLYAAPPAPASVPDEDLLHMAASAIEDLLSNKDSSGAGVWADVPAKLRRAAMLQGADGNSPVIPDWQAKAEKMAEIHGTSFVVFRNGESPQCVEPSKVIISFTDEGLGHGSAAPQQEA
ncbi:hypothetical protein AAEK16_000416 [Enterobacter roggenkampii]